MSSNLALDSAKLPVPASEAEVTAQWLQAALVRTFSDVTLETLQAARIGEAYGLASRIFRYRLGAGRCAPSVVIKLWNTDSPAGINEVLFYRTFGGIVGTRIPACFHAAGDRATKRGVLILEDLNTALQGDCLQQLTFNQAQAVARSLASVHATWLQHPVLQTAEWLRSLSRWKQNAALPCLLTHKAFRNK